MVISIKIKPELKIRLGFSSTILGAIDTTFLILYGLGYFAAGILSDKFKPRAVLLCGMCVGMLALWIVLAN